MVLSAETDIYQCFQTLKLSFTFTFYTCFHPWSIYIWRHCFVVTLNDVLYGAEDVTICNLIFTAKTVLILLEYDKDRMIYYIVGVNYSVRGKFEKWKNVGMAFNCLGKCIHLNSCHLQFCWHKRACTHRYIVNVLWQWETQKKQTLRYWLVWWTVPTTSITEINLISDSQFCSRTKCILWSMDSDRAKLVWVANFWFLWFETWTRTKNSAFYIFSIFLSVKQLSGQHPMNQTFIFK